MMVAAASSSSSGCCCCYYSLLPLLLGNSRIRPWQIERQQHPAGELSLTLRRASMD
jgi:hypothetical protein